MCATLCFCAAKIRKTAHIPHYFLYKSNFLLYFSFNLLTFATFSCLQTKETQKNAEIQALKSGKSKQESLSLPENHQNTTQKLKLTPHHVWNRSYFQD